MRHTPKINVHSLIVVIVLSLVTGAVCDDPSVIEKKSLKSGKKLPKDPLFITDADLENLYDEWEEADDEKLPVDELPAYKRQHLHPPKTNLNEDLFKDPEKLMIASKKGKTVMAFVTIDNEPTREQTELLTQRWQVGLTNNHMKCERFVVSDDRAIFVFEDGALAFEAKDFLIDQPELKEYSIDNRVWHGRASLARNEECPWDANDPAQAKSNSCSTKSKNK